MTRIYFILFATAFFGFNPRAQSTSDFGASASPDGRSVTYYSYRDGKAEIYKMDVDGSNQTRLTANQEAHDFEPAWSPIGDRIAYISTNQNESSNFEIMIMDADGRNIKNLTSHTANDFSPAWSPDGQSIVFHSDRDGNEEVYTMSIGDGTLTRITESEGRDNYASWSHDGRYLSFSSDRDGGKSRIFIYDFQTRQTRRLTKGDSEELGARWSPISNQLVLTIKDGGDNDVFVVNMDGSGLKNITNNYEDDYFPNWSHDGKKVYFTSSFNGGDEIYSIDLASGEQVNLTNTSTFNGSPGLSTDGKYIYFNSKRDNNLEIYRMNIDGTNEKRITNSPNGESTPSGSDKELFYVESQDIFRLTLKTGRKENLTKSEASDHTPVLSANGKKLFYITNEYSEHDQIYSIDLGSGKKVQLTSGNFHHGGISLSTDGTKIVYHTIVGREVDVWIMNSDGSGQRKLTNGEGASFNPDISPGNQEVIFVTNRDGRRFREIYKLKLSSGELIRLTENYGRNDMPRWTKDGKGIIFESSRDGNHHLYKMAADGSGKQQLTFFKR